MMSPEEKIASLEKQIAEYTEGDRDVLMCPYCGGENRKENQALCCELFATAAVAILDRQEQARELQKLAEFVDKVSCN